MPICPRRAFAAFLLLGLTAPASAEIVVIVNKANPVRTLTVDQVEKIFLGKLNSFPDGTLAIPLDLPRGDTRDLFYARITGGKSSNQIKAYWSRIVFTSTGQPPFEVDSPQDMVNSVQQNPYRIGYVERANAGNAVRVVLSLP